MKRALTVWILTGATAWLSGAQPAVPTGPEGADVHVTAPGGKQDVTFLPRSGLELKGQTMINLITMAYGVEESKVVGGPPWLVIDRFDVSARTPNVTAFDDARKVLQGILETRFHLVTHKDQRAFPVFYLTLGKKLQMKENKSDGPGGCNLKVDNGLRTLTCTHTETAQLCEQLRQRAAAYFNQPVIDHTGLKGFYDFSLAWTGRGNLGAAGDDAARGVSAFDAVDKDLGLKVENGKEMLPVTAIDSVDRKPTPNAPGVVAKAHVGPTEFDAADIHPTRPGSKPEASKMENGRLELFGMSLRDLINIDYDFDDQMIMGGDKWIDSEHYDLIAKSTPTASLEDLRVMLKKLLAESFKLQVHEDKQPVTVYALTVGKGSKLKPTAGEGRGCTAGGKDGMSGFSCRNATIDQLVEQVKQRGRGYIDSPVVDLTGLTDAYDFELYWTPVNRLTIPGKGDAGARAADPNGVSVFEAIDRQLGLKLAQTKRPMPVLVIDHAEKLTN